MYSKEIIKQLKKIAAKHQIYKTEEETNNKIDITITKDK